MFYDLFEITMVALFAVMLLNIVRGSGS